MASLIYNSAVGELATGTLNFGTDDFLVMLVTAGYVPDKDTHFTLGDVTNEVSAPGYTPGGNAVTIDVVVDLALDRTNIELGGATWGMSTITAAGAVYYKLADGSLIAYIDFGGNVTSAIGTFTLGASMIRIQN